MRVGSGLNAPVESSEGEYVVSLGDLLQVVWKRLWVIALCAVVCVVAALAVDFARTPMYQASIQILVGQEQGDAELSSLGSDVQGLQQLTQTVAEAVATRPVAEGVIQELGLQVSADEFLSHVNVEQVPETQFIEVSYEHPDPERAREIANATGEVFAGQVEEVSPSANAITATLWERAVTPEEPSSPDPVRDGLLALILGSMFGLGLVFLMEYLDDSWRTPEEVEYVSGRPNLGVIPTFRSRKSKAPKEAAENDAL